MTRRSTLLSTLLLLSGCAVGPVYQAPVAAVPPAWSRQPSGAQAVQAVAWWQSFHDPMLDRLVDQALAANPTLDKAGAVVREARAAYDEAAGRTAPTVNGGISGREARNSLVGFPAMPGFSAPSYSQVSAGLDASWEIDLFGRERHATEAAGMATTSAEEAEQGARLGVAGDVAQTYVLLRGLQARTAVAEAAIRSRRSSLGLVQLRLHAGRGTMMEVAQAETALATAQAILPDLERSRALAMHALAVLTGQPPAALDGSLAATSPIPAATLPSAGVPADLARRRPDVRRAERELAKAVAEAGVATADLYPRLTLSGNIMLTGTSVIGALTGASGAAPFGIGPSLSIPLLDGGRRRAALRGAEARVDEAAAAWRMAVLAALRDVEDALAGCDREAAHGRALQQAARQARRLVSIARDRYTQGEGDMLAVQDAERTLFITEDSLASSRAALATEVVRLNKALGGGWSQGNSPA